MKIACPTCGSDANLPEDKIPKDRDFSFKCPKCGVSVPVKAAAGNPGGAGFKADPAALGQNPSQFQAGGPKQALVCIMPSPGRNRVVAGLENAGFTVHIPETQDQALKNLRYCVYPLVMIDETFDGDKTMAGYMDNLDMFLRRKICLVRLSPDFETGNAMTALNKSANYVIKSQDLEQQDSEPVETALALALSEHEQMYAVFNDSMKAVGKA